MEKWNLLFGVVGGAVVAVAAVFSLFLAPIRVELSAMTAKLNEIENQLDKFDERQRRHTGDAEKHVTAEWKADIQQRTRNLENVLMKIASKLGVD